MMNIEKTKTVLHNLFEMYETFHVCYFDDGEITGGEWFRLGMKIFNVIGIVKNLEDAIVEIKEGIDDEEKTALIEFLRADFDLPEEWDDLEAKIEEALENLINFMTFAGSWG